MRGSYYWNINPFALFDYYLEIKVNFKVLVSMVLFTSRQNNKKRDILKCLYETKLAFEHFQLV